MTTSQFDSQSRCSRDRWDSLPLICADYKVKNQILFFRSFQRCLKDIAKCRRPEPESRPIGGRRCAPNDIAVQIEWQKFKTTGPNRGNAGNIFGQDFGWNASIGKPVSSVRLLREVRGTQSPYQYLNFGRYCALGFLKLRNSGVLEPKTNCEYNRKTNEISRRPILYGRKASRIELRK